MIKVERYVTIKEIVSLEPYRHDETQYVVQFRLHLGEIIPANGFVNASDLAEEMFQEWRQ